MNQINYFNLLLALWTAPFFLFGETLSVDRLEKNKEEWIGREVTVRGFIVPLNKNTLVLSPTPKLKSCCKEGNQGEKRVFLLKNFERLTPSSKVETVTGFLFRPDVENSYYIINQKNIY